MTNVTAHDTGMIIIPDDEAAARLAATAVISCLWGMRVGGLQLVRMEDREPGCEYGYGHFAQASKKALAEQSIAGNQENPASISALVICALRPLCTMKSSKRLQHVYFCSNEDADAWEDNATHLVTAGEGNWIVYNWAAAELRKHAKTVETLASMLLQHGYLDAEEVNTLLQPLKATEAKPRTQLRLVEKVDA